MTAAADIDNSIKRKRFRVSLNKWIILIDYTQLLCSRPIFVLWIFTAPLALTSLLLPRTTSISFLSVSANVQMVNKNPEIISAMKTGRNLNYKVTIWSEHCIANSNMFDATTSGHHWADASVVMVGHRLLSSVMHSSDNSEWSVHSARLSFHDFCSLLQRLPSTVPTVWFSAAYHVARHGQTTVTCNAWRLTARTPNVVVKQWLFTIHYVNIVGMTYASPDVKRNIT